MSNKNLQSETLVGLLSTTLGSQPLPYILSDHYTDQAIKFLDRGNLIFGWINNSRAEAEREHEKKYNPLENFSLDLPERTKIPTIKSAIKTHYQSLGFDIVRENIHSSSDYELTFKDKKEQYLTVDLIVAKVKSRRMFVRVTKKDPYKLINKD